MKILLFTLAMAATLTEEKIVDKIEVLESGHCQVREATIIKRDGVEVSRSFRRFVVEPDQDKSNLDAVTKAVCSAGATPERIQKFTALKEKMK